MRTQDLPEKHKHYEIVRRDKRHFPITGDLKIKIMNLQGQLFELPDGTIINKADVMGIDFIKEKTHDEFARLPDAEQKKIIDSMPKLITT